MIHIEKLPIRKSRPPRLGGSAWRKAGLALVFAWFLLGGIGHFVWTTTFASIVPPYIPFPRLVVLVTGAFEIAAALALLSKKMRRLSGLALIGFAVCVTPVHIEMLREADRYQGVGALTLWVRLLMQPVLIWIIWLVTQPGRDIRAHVRPSQVLQSFE